MRKFKEVQDDFLKKAEVAGIDKSDIDFIFCNVMGINRSKLASVSEISDYEEMQARRILKKRIKGIPLDQIFGYTNFYGLDFYINREVLIPRPETELLCEEIMKILREGLKGLDIGTGSGSIAITLSKLKNMDMLASDISAKALRVARKNNKLLGASVKFIKSDLFKKIDGKFDFIVSNPPYIKTADIDNLQTEVRDHEPHLALDGKEDGLYFYREIIKSAPKYLKKGGMIFFELGALQSEMVRNMLEENFTDIKIKKDYNRIDRIIYAIKK